MDSLFVLWLPLPDCLFSLPWLRRAVVERGRSNQSVLRRLLLCFVSQGVSFYRWEVEELEEIALKRNGAGVLNGLQAMLLEDISDVRGPACPVLLRVMVCVAVVVGSLDTS